MLALGAGGAIALAGVLFAVFRSAGSASSAPPPSPPPPVQVATPAAAVAAADQPPTKPVGPREVGPAVRDPDPAPDPASSGASLPPASQQVVAEAPHPAPVEPHAETSHRHPATAKHVAVARPDAKGSHVPAMNPEVAATPTALAPIKPSAGSAETPPAHGSGATEPAASPPPAGHGSPAETAPARPMTTPESPGPATPGPAVKKDEIDVAATRAVVRTHVAAIQQCYERAKMDDQSLAGSMTVRITISPDGAVTGTQVTKSTIGSPAVERCVTNEVSHWHLPKPTGGNAASLLYPFVFE
jgi:TonB family protein